MAKRRIKEASFEEIKEFLQREIEYLEKKGDNKEEIVILKNELKELERER